MNRFQRWALATTIATYILIMVGGMVRASGAGLGCPDWPKCFGRYYPPLNESQVPDTIDASKFDFQLAWIEYTNRMVGVIIGLLIIGTLYHALKAYRQQPRVLYPTVGAFVLVLFEGWLGGELVKHELQPWHITLHMLIALVIVSLLLYATLSALFPQLEQNLNRDKRRLNWLVLGVLGITLIQISLGTEVRGGLEIVKKENPTLARADWIEEVGLIDQVHRSFSWLVLVGILGINYLLHRRLTPKQHRLQWAARVATLLVVVQILAGIGLAYAGLPPILQVAHLVVASLMVGAFMTIYVLNNRVPLQQQEAMDKHPTLQSPTA